MDELIARLEAATAPDRALDGPLAVLAGWEWHGDGGPFTHEKWAGHWVIPGHPNNGTFTPERLCACTMITDEQGNTREPPRFTASVDAAIELQEALLPGWEWALFRYAAPGRGGRNAATARVFPYREQQKGSGDWEGINPAIALCIAVLKASKSQTAQAPKQEVDEVPK